MPSIEYVKDSPGAKKGDIKDIKEPFARALVLLKRAKYVAKEDDLESVKTAPKKATPKSNKTPTKPKE